MMQFHQQTESSKQQNVEQHAIEFSEIECQTTVTRTRLRMPQSSTFALYLMAGLILPWRTASSFAEQVCLFPNLVLKLHYPSTTILLYIGIALPSRSCGQRRCMQYAIRTSMQEWVMSVGVQCQRVS